MADYKDLANMDEILSIAIVRLETEEQFFRRSGDASTSSVAKSLFHEIAEDFGGLIGGMEARRRNLAAALTDLQAGREPVAIVASPAAIGQTGQVASVVTQDPVCGMQVDETEAGNTSNYQGKTYSFCSSDCKQAFDLAPNKYVKDQQGDA